VDIFTTTAPSAVELETGESKLKVTAQSAANVINCFFISIPKMVGVPSILPTKPCH
jgi:hypothetical protein